MKNSIIVIGSMSMTQSEEEEMEGDKSGNEEGIGNDWHAHQPASGDGVRCFNTPSLQVELILFCPFYFHLILFHR